MRALAIALLSVAAGCTMHRAPAWERSTVGGGTGVTDPSPEELVRRSRESLAKGRAIAGPPGLAALDDAVTLAERALLANPAFAARAREHALPPRLFSTAEAAQLPALAAYADALLEWSRRQGTATLLEEQDRIRAALERAWNLDRNFDHAAPDRLLGILECALPVGSGADYVTAVEHFESAIAADPAYLPNLLAYAVEYAARMHEDALYVRLLDRVLAADLTQLPPPDADNREAQARARVLRAAAR